MSPDLQQLIDSAWEERDGLGPQSSGEVGSAVDSAIAALDSGEARIAEKVDGEWVINQWLKKAVLLSFRLNPMRPIPGGPGGASWWDKVPSKFADWGDKEFEAAGFRAVPGAIVMRVA
jgi:2,3,4,5-tetrahydropyridine-2-carboxylate N-succinyltransferase